MKKLTFLLFTIGTIVPSAQSPDEALNHLKKTQKELISLVDGLSETQINFRSKTESWSIAECMEHIAISEKNIMGLIETSLEEEANPSRRSEVVITDDQLLQLITSREQKVKTRREFEPTNSFGSFKNNLKAFNKRRKSNLKFIQNTDLDLRNHYVQFPFGLIDSYQAILFMSGHTTRHTDQIKEIMKQGDFPG